jgi:hypothetical protein
MRPKGPKGRDILDQGTTLASSIARANQEHDTRVREDVVRSLSREPLAMLFSCMANWVSAVLMSGPRQPELTWVLRFVPTAKRWRLFIVVDGEEVFEGLSSHVGQLAIDAERAFRLWADEEDRKENEARLEASVTDLQKE